MTLPSTMRIALVVLFLIPSFAFPQAVLKPPASEANVKAFLEEEVAFDAYLFPPGRFPDVRWKNIERVEKLIGTISLSVEYFDRSFNRVDRAERVGRYGAVVRGTMPDGFSLVRYATLFCCDADLDDYSPDVPIAIQPLPSFGVSTTQWKIYQQNLRRFSFGSLLTSPKHDPDAAVFLAGLTELDTSSLTFMTPRVLDRLWWTRLRRGARTAIPSIAARTATNSGITVHQQTVSESSLFTSDQLAQIRLVCSDWTERSRVPMTALVIHKGAIVFHEAFGRKSDGGEMTLDTKTWMASITKLLTGVLVMQFVDRGLVELDAPIDRYLPELSTSQPCPLTLRNLLTHTSGLSWTGEWASDWEPSMENRVAQAIPFITPGRTFKYHRSGYALASKILERVSGETVPQLYQRMIFDPLEMNNAFAENSYGGLYSTASDLGRFGQMLLNRGRYGSAEILSDSAFAAMLPRPLALKAGERARSWGIGCTFLGGSGLSDSSFGHEAASGSVLRIDPVNDLVVIVARDKEGTSGKEYQQFVGTFLQAVTRSLKTSLDFRHD